MSEAPAMAEATKLLARCRRNGIELRRHGEAIGIAAAFEIGEAMLDQVRELKPQLLALVRDAPPSRSPRLEAMLAAAAAAFAESGGIEIRRPKGNGWARSGAAMILRRMRRWNDRAAAVAARDAWRERVAIATSGGELSEFRAEAVAFEELERRAAEWSMRGPAKTKPRPRNPPRGDALRPRNPL